MVARRSVGKLGPENRQRAGKDRSIAAHLSDALDDGGAKSQLLIYFLSRRVFGGVTGLALAARSLELPASGRVAENLAKKDLAVTRSERDDSGRTVGHRAADHAHLRPHRSAREAHRVAHEIVELVFDQDSGLRSDRGG